MLPGPGLWAPNTEIAAAVPTAIAACGGRINWAPSVNAIVAEGFSISVMFAGTLYRVLENTPHVVADRVVHGA